MNEEIRKAFTYKPMISYRSSRKPSSYLVRTELYPINRTVVYFKCGSKRSEMFKYITETDTFTSAVTRETFKISHRFDCDKKCLVYLMTCTAVKTNALVKLQITFVVDGTTPRLKIEVLIEENSVCKNICTNI